MKLLEFPCCHRTCPLEEEEKLTPAAKRASPDKRRRRERRGRSASLWRPSLMAISENVTSAATAAEAKGAGGWKGKAKTKAKLAATDAVAFRTADCEDYRLREAVPAFAPTAFLF
ncbi:uncharacterized protein LOC141847620 [Curcuma longa]|uniref:uncharacterized protein LOC141847620 n=1 Tax=Curcuma longa TaxID=136217 RepID=UPI003D9DEE83